MILKDKLTKFDLNELSRPFRFDPIPHFPEKMINPIKKKNRRVSSVTFLQTN